MIMVLRSPRHRSHLSGRNRCVLAGMVFFWALGTARAQYGPDIRAVPVPQPIAPEPSSGIGRENRTVSWKTLPANFLDDQRQIWTFPVQLAKGKHWVPTISITGVTAGLVALDPHDTPYFRRTDDFAGFNKVFSGSITAAGIAIAPASIYLVGAKRHDTYAEQTALFAAESYADTAVVSAAIKTVTRRTRPNSIPPNGDFSDTWFKTGWGSSFSGKASFPSGHTITAFSVATVIARRYGRHRWVPFVAYGLAGVVGFSRVTNQAHFPSDVFAGAALGYCIGRFAVLRR
jgi:membrane-associated phospholipid phosphatase